MPWMKNGKRDYSREYALYQGNEEQKKKRAMRNGARRKVASKVGKAAISGKDIGHKKALSKGGSNGLGNLFVQSVKTNRSFRRNKDGSMRSERSRRGK